MHDAPAGAKPAMAPIFQQPSVGSSSGGGGSGEGKRARTECPEPQQMEREPGVNVLDSLSLDPFTRSKVIADERLGSTLSVMAAVMEKQFERLSLQLPSQVCALAVGAIQVLIWLWLTVLPPSIRVHAGGFCGSAGGPKSR